MSNVSWTNNFLNADAIDVIIPIPAVGMFMRRFVLNRKVDVSGISGTGVIAEGCVFSNGVVMLSWLTSLYSMSWYPSIDNMIGIHGHDGQTEIVWWDDDAS